MPRTMLAQLTDQHGTCHGDCHDDDHDIGHDNDHAVGHNGGIGDGYEDAHYGVTLTLIMAGRVEAIITATTLVMMVTAC